MTTTQSERCVCCEDAAGAHEYLLPSLHRIQYFIQLRGPATRIEPIAPVEDGRKSITDGQ